MSAAQELPCELEPRRGPAEAILSRRSSRAELPEWLLKAGADVQDESGSESEYDPDEEPPDEEEEAAEFEVEGIVRGRVRLHAAKARSSGQQVDDARCASLADRKYVRSTVKRGVGPSGGDDFEACPGREQYAAGKKVSEREESEAAELFRSLWLFAPACENEAHGQTVGQRTGEEVVGAWASRAPERASTERRGAPRDSTSCACASDTPACAGR